MSDRRFPILGIEVPPMLGRDAIINKMIGALTKAVPDHLQMVGPRFAGKTVILHELAARLQNADSPYAAVVLCDLGHQTPATDAQFMQRLCAQLSTALQGDYPDYASFLESEGENPYRGVAEVLEALNKENKKVLVIMDRFDKPLSNGHLTRNLWDQLLDLARKPSLRLVTASRQRLYELLRNPDSLTSDFWGIFDTVIRVGCFDEHDFNKILENLEDLDIAPGAKTELWNASNGFPIFMLGVLNTLCQTSDGGHINADTLRTACDASLPAARDHVDQLWRACPPSAQDLFRRVHENGPVARAGISATDIDALVERGFVHATGNKVERPNRLLCRCLEEQPDEGSALARLFGSVDGYRDNFRGVLERRIAQIDGIDPTLKQFLIRAADVLPDYPEVFVTDVRGIVDQAFKLIWNGELGRWAIPPGWMDIWKRNRERSVEEWETSFPTGGSRVRLLNLMTGKGKSAPCAKHITKGTSTLMDAANAFGDFGQHLEGASVDPGTAYAALHLCIELAAALTRELAVPKQLS